MSASLNSLARNVPPSLIAALVEKRVWLASQGLTYARVLPAEERVEALIGISSHLEHPEMERTLQEALGVARGIGDARSRASALVALGKLEEALEAARRIGDEESSANALAELALQLANAGRVEEAQGVARGIGDARSRARPGGAGSAASECGSGGGGPGSGAADR